MWSRSTKQRRSAMRRKQSLVIRRAIRTIIASITRDPWLGFPITAEKCVGIEAWIPTTRPGDFWHQDLPPIPHYFDAQGLVLLTPKETK